MQRTQRLLSSVARRPAAAPAPAPGGAPGAYGPPPSIRRRHRRIFYSEPPAAVSTRQWLPPEAVAEARSLNAAVVGAPNAGKSTLVNRLLGAKVSAVSPKYNTTRDRVLGVCTHGRAQLVLTDTPGFVTEAEVHRYYRPLVTAAKEAVPTSDVVLLVVDAAARFDATARAAMEGMVALCAASQASVMLVANKASRECVCR